MDKDMKELIEPIVISENIELSCLIEDIVPRVERKFTNVELEAERKQEFSLVIYKKPNPFKKVVNSIKIIVEKIRIIKHSNKNEFARAKNISK